jgi:threonine dehydrogenase-like Zn-dependent dehydrogenase
LKFTTFYITFKYFFQRRGAASFAAEASVIVKSIMEPFACERAQADRLCDVFIYISVGIVKAIGDDVRNLKSGDRVVIPSTIACGYCTFIRRRY